MDHIRLLEAMKASISEVLETMFFMPVDFVSTEAVPDTPSAADKPMAAGLGFGGPVEGRFQLQVPEGLAGSISADFLGIDTGRLTREDVDGTIKEMINMLAGNTLSHYDPQMVFDLGVPERVPVEKPPTDPSSAGARVDLHIQTLDSRMLMTVTIMD